MNIFAVKVENGNMDRAAVKVFCKVIPAVSLTCAVSGGGAMCAVVDHLPITAGILGAISILLGLAAIAGIVTISTFIVAVAVEKK